MALYQHLCIGCQKLRFVTMKIKDFQLERYFAQHEFTAEYMLSSSDCDGYSLSDVLEVADPKELHLWEHMTFGYSVSEGNPELREAILQHYKVKDINNIIVASPGELNFITMNLLLSEKDHVVCISPCYQSLSEIVETIGSEISFWKPSQEDWTFDVEQLESLIQPNTKLLIINFPHNPTGSYLKQQELDQIVAIARKHDIYLFSDEMYHKLLCGSSTELKPVSDLYEKGISLWGTSKTFGLAGLRTGWLVSQDTDFLKRVVKFKDYLSICNSTPSEVLSIIAVNHIDHFLQQNVSKIERNIAIFKSFAEDHDLIKSFIPPKAGSTAFVSLNIDSTSQSFSDRLVAETGIMTVPAEMFGHRGKMIRIGFGRKNLEEVLAHLSKWALNNQHRI